MERATTSPRIAARPKMESATPARKLAGRYSNTIRCRPQIRVGGVDDPSEPLHFREVFYEIALSLFGDRVDDLVDHPIDGALEVLDPAPQHPLVIQLELCCLLRLGFCDRLGHLNLSQQP